MTLPVGYVKGDMTPSEACAYLQKLGIPEAQYSEVALKAVRVPPGFIAISPNNFIYRPGRFIPAAKGEHDWETFIHSSPMRGWRIEETYDRPDIAGEDLDADIEIPENFATSRLRSVLGPNYTIPELRMVADYYNNQVREARGQEGADQAEIDAKEEQIAQILNDLVEDYIDRVRLTQETSNDNFPPSTLEKLRYVRERSKGILAYKPTDPAKQGIVKASLPTANFKITVRGAGKKGEGGAKEESSNIDMGTMLSALYLASERGNARAGEFLEDILADKLTGRNIQISLIIADLFPGVTSHAEAYNLFFDILNAEKIKTAPAEEQEKLSLQAAARLAEYMSPPVAGSVEAQKRLLRQQELMLKMEASLAQARGSTRNLEKIKEITKDIDSLSMTRDFLDSIATGNFVVQTALDFGMAATTEPSYEVVKTIFENLDKIFVFSSGDLSFSQIFDSIVEPDGENLPDQLQNLKSLLREKISQSPVILRGGRYQEDISVKAQQAAYDTIMTMLRADPDGLITSHVLQGEIPGTVSVRKILVDHFKQENPQYGYVFTKSIAPKLGREISRIISKRQPTQSVTEYLDSPQFKYEIKKYLEDGMGLGQDLSAEIVLSISNRAKKFGGHLSAAFGSTSDTRLSEYVARSFSALLTFSIQANLSGFGNSLTMMDNATRIISQILAGSISGYNPQTGTFFSSEDAIFSEVVNRLRVLPPLDDDGNFHWDEGFRDELLSSYLARYGHKEEVITDPVLVKYMSHTEDPFPSHYLLVANVRNRASSLMDKEGNRVLDREDGYRFIHDVGSSNLTDNKELSAATKTLEGVERVVSEFASGDVVDRGRAVQLLLSDNFIEDTNNYSLVSLASSLRVTGLGQRTQMKLAQRYGEVIRHRVTKLSPKYAETILSYLSPRLKIDSVSTIGHSLEALSSVPLLVHHLESSGATNVSTTPTIDDLLGVSWAGEDGSTYNFGSISYAKNGTIDYMVIRETNQDIQIYPGEGKMESSGGSIPHHGNPDHFIGLVAKLWKKAGKKIQINPTTVINMPSQSKDHSASYLELSMDYPIRGIQSSGRTFSHGRLVSSTTLRRRKR